MRISPFKIEHWLQKGYTEEEARQLIAERRPTNIAYWLKKCATESEAQERWLAHHTRCVKHKNNLTLLIETYGPEKGKQLFEERKLAAQRNNKRCAAYWIARGYTESEASEQISKLQNTFSLVSCQTKWGIEEGMRRWKERQEKWQATLKSKPSHEIAAINARKRVTIEVLEAKYGDAWLEKFQSSRKYNDNTPAGQLTKRMLAACQTLDDIVEKAPELSDRYLIFKHILRKKSIQKHFEYTPAQINEIFAKIAARYGVEGWVASGRRYGTTTVVDGRVYTSKLEADVAILLNALSLDFIYNLKYPGQTSTHYRYDFYIAKYDLYIELAGMRKSEISATYLDRLDKKKKYCIDKNINLVIVDTAEQLRRFLEEKHGSS